VWSVALLGSWSVTILSPAKTAELIEMPRGVWTRVSQGNHALDWVQIPPCKGAVLMGKRYLHGKWLAVRASSTTESELCRSAGPSVFQLQEIMLKSDKI